MNTEKKAMDPENKAMLGKYLKLGLGAAVLSAGIGAVIRRNRAEKERVKANDISKYKNSIIVPIKKSKFLEGVMTPDELAASRGEDQQGDDGSQQKVEVASLTPEEIAAKKKSILRGSKFNFFGSKAAETKAAESKGEEDENVTVKEETKVVETRSPDEGEHDEGNKAKLNPRNELGQFVSPTDPTGVKQQEKDAEYDFTGSLKNLMFHPFKTIGGVIESASTRPVYIAAGGIGAMYLASMIVDKINDIRSKKAKGDASSARERYVKLLQGEEEKTAAETGYRDTENPISAAGTALGASFIIPAALSAMIAYKIMEKRKEDKAKEKMMADSFPEEPIITYKMASGEETRISPETALALIRVKRSMFKLANDNEMSRNVKSAKVTMKDLERWGGNAVNAVGAVVNPVGTAISYGAGKLVENAQGAGKLVEKAQGAINKLNMYNKYKPIIGIIDQNWKDGKLTDNGYKLLADPANDELVYDMSRMIAGSESGGGVPEQYADKVDAIRKDPRTADLLQNKFSNDKAIGYKQRWGAWQKEEIDNSLNEYFGKDGFLRSIFGWLAHNTGLGGWFFRNGIGDKLGTVYENNQTKAPSPAQNQAQNPAQNANTGANDEAANNTENAKSAQPAEVAPVIETPTADRLVYTDEMRAQDFGNSSPTNGVYRVGN